MSCSSCHWGETCNRDAEQIHCNYHNESFPSDHVCYDYKERAQTSAQFKCKCGGYTAWITEGEVTSPCPVCFRTYLGVYSKKHLTILAEEQQKMDTFKKRMFKKLRIFKPNN